MELISVIEYRGDNNTVVWRHPTVSFNNNSTLIVRESQEAIFFLNGEIMDSLPPGKHKLETGKIPILSEKLSHIITKGDLYQSEVYFVNLVDFMSINWGTNPRIEIIENNSGENIPYDVGVHGGLNIKVSNPRKLLLKYVGTEDVLYKDTLVGFIEPIVVQKIRGFIINTIKKYNVSIFELDSYIDNFATEIRSLFDTVLDEFGVAVSNFWIDGFDYPSIFYEFKHIRDEQAVKTKDQIFRSDYEIKEAQIQAQKNIIDAEAQGRIKEIEGQATANSLQAQGITKKEELAFEVAKALAENDNVGNMASAGVGIGMIGGMVAGVGGPLSNIVSNALSETNSKPTNTNENFLGIPNPILEDDNLNENNVEKRVNDVKKLLEMGVITQSQYDQKINEILETI